MSSLSGYCRQPGGHLVLFSVLMNRLTNLSAARDAQDRMATAIASYSAATVDEVGDSVSAPSMAAATVPASLSLTLGAPANFGTFLPGVTRSYDGHDRQRRQHRGRRGTERGRPRRPAPGRLTNGPAALPQPLEVRANDGAWAPVGGAPQRC